MRSAIVVADDRPRCRSRMIIRGTTPPSTVAPNTATYTTKISCYMSDIRPMRAFRSETNTSASASCARMPPLDGRGLAAFGRAAVAEETTTGSFMGCSSSCVAEGAEAVVVEGCASVSDPVSGAAHSVFASAAAATAPSEVAAASAMTVFAAVAVESNAAEMLAPPPGGDNALAEQVAAAVVVASGPAVGVTCGNASS